MSTITTEDTALIVSVSQVLEGDHRCYCGKDAALYVYSEPDGEVGYSCYEHGMGWADAALGVARHMFGPKEA